MNEEKGPEGPCAPIALCAVELRRVGASVAHVQPNSWDPNSDLRTGNRLRPIKTPSTSAGPGCKRFQAAL